MNSDKNDEALDIKALSTSLPALNKLLFNNPLDSKPLSSTLDKKERKRRMLRHEKELEKMPEIIVRPKMRKKASRVFMTN